MEKRYDILIHKGSVVSGSGIRKADVAIKGEKIARVEPSLRKEEAERIIDASGKYVIP